jgi:hypothetical protein
MPTVLQCNRQTEFMIDSAKQKDGSFRTRTSYDLNLFARIVIERKLCANRRQPGKNGAHTFDELGNSRKSTADMA